MIAKLILFALRILSVPAFLLMPWLLFASEDADRAAKAMLREAKERLVELDSVQPDPARDGELVHLIGQPTIEGQLTDDLTGLSVEGLVLERKVEMYQWKRRLRGRFAREVRYVKAWSDELIDSSRFPPENQNPRKIPYSSSTQAAEPVRLGGFTLSRQLVKKIDGYQPVPIGEALLEELAKRPWGPVTLVDGSLYFGLIDPQDPPVGSVRIAYRYVPRPESVSAIALQQEGGQLVPFIATNGEKLEVLRKGRLDPDVLWRMQDGVRVGQLWFLRVFGFVVMLIALRVFIASFRNSAKAPAWIARIRVCGAWGFAFLVSSGVGLLSVGAGKAVVFPSIGAGLVIVGVSALALGLRCPIRQQNQCT